MNKIKVLKLQYEQQTNKKDFCLRSFWENLPHVWKICVNQIDIIKKHDYKRIKQQMLKKNVHL